MNKHTPGPWEIIDKYRVHSALGADSGDGCPCDDRDGWLIADCSESYANVGGEHCPLGDEPHEANIRLIAAAPDLLETLENLRAAFVTAVGEVSPFARCALAEVDATIAKARGEA